MSIAKAKKDKKRYGNWEVMASYILKGISPQEVFKSFLFRDDEGNILNGDIDRKHKDLFIKFVSDMRFPSSVRSLCGRHMGRKPGLGFELDCELFEYLLETYLLPNCELASEQKTIISNSLIQTVIESLLAVATEDQLKYVTFSSEYVKKMTKKNKFFNVNLVDKRTFNYQKSSCLSFRNRWFIFGSELIIPENIQTSNMGDIVPQSEFGKQYPVNGYKICEGSKQQVKKMKKRKFTIPGGEHGKQLLRSHNNLSSSMLIADL
jgi:hypothetical protein